MASHPPAVSSSRLSQAVDFFRRPIELFEKCRRTYGDCFTLRLPAFAAPITFISDPDAVREIFAADGTGRVKSGSIAAPTMELVIGKHSMLSLDGSKHHRHRALISPYFSRAQFTKFGDDLIRLIDQEIEEWPRGARFPIRPKMQSITLQVILRIIFGERARLAIQPSLLRKFFGRSHSLFPVSTCWTTEGD
jgi:cytochrome P450